MGPNEERVRLHLNRSGLPIGSPGNNLHVAARKKLFIIRVQTVAAVVALHARVRAVNLLEPLVNNGHFLLLLDQ